MAILDEVVGPMNWAREHSRDNANCTVSIYDAARGLWVSKEDTGSASNMEPEKGLASDSFKRACICWGIGRELYTAPTLFIPASRVNIYGDANRPKCADSFTVEKIAYDDNRRISAIYILNQKRERVLVWMAGNE